jgi:hypothetical protein
MLEGCSIRSEMHDRYKALASGENRGLPLTDITGNDDAYLGGRGRLSERDQRDSVSSGRASRYQAYVGGEPAGTNSALSEFSL